MLKSCFHFGSGVEPLLEAWFFHHCVAFPCSGDHNIWRVQRRVSSPSSWCENTLLLEETHLPEVRCCLFRHLVTGAFVKMHSHSQTVTSEILAHGLLTSVSAVFSHLVWVVSLMGPEPSYDLPPCQPLKDGETVYTFQKKKKDLIRDVIILLFPRLFVLSD